MYKGLNIATAKVTPDESAGIRHHIFDDIDPTKHLTVLQFLALARPIASTHDVASHP